MQTDGLVEKHFKEKWTKKNYKFYFLQCYDNL